MTTVIINEFELIPAQGSAAVADVAILPADTSAPPDTASAESKVKTTMNVIQRQAERALRVWAH